MEDRYTRLMAALGKISPSSGVEDTSQRESALVECFDILANEFLKEGPLSVFDNVILNEVTQGKRDYPLTIEELRQYGSDAIIGVVVRNLNVERKVRLSHIVKKTPSALLVLKRLSTFIKEIVEANQQRELEAHFAAIRAGTWVPKK